MQVYTVGSSLKQNSPIFHMMSRAHSFPRKNMPNSVGQLTKFRGKIVQILRLATALVIEGWHYTKGWRALAISMEVCIGLKLC